MSEADADLEKLAQAIQQGGTYREVAASAGLTVGQLRYRLRKYREEQEPLSVPEDSAPPIASDPLNDERWVRSFDEDIIVALPKDPTQIYVYWNVSTGRRNVICECFQCGWDTLPKFLRIHDVTDIDFDGLNAHQTWTHSVHGDAEDWFVRDLTPGHDYVVDYCTTTLSNHFFVFLRAHKVSLPRETSLSVNGLDDVVRVKPIQSSVGDQTVDSVFAEDVLFGCRSPWISRFNGYSLS